MEKLFAIIGALAVILLMVVILAFPTMWAWNHIMPKFFLLKEMEFTDALWLNLLASCLFKSTRSSSKKD